MSRLPGDGGSAVWGVAALLLAVSDALAARWGSVRLQGELAGFSQASSGHCYFSLKDRDGAPALVRCAMFRRSAGLLDFKPRDGQLVEVRGRLALYEPRGDLQLVVESMRPAGQGSLYEEFLRLKARLEAEGLFDPIRRKPLPAVPRCIGVVTSLQAAALRDVLTTLARRAPQVPVRIFPAAVQGAEAPAQLVAALAAAQTGVGMGTAAPAGPAPDVLLLVRGGGSLEDLWSFNDERVVRAVAGCRLPLISGVGHETDLTLVDLAADLRAPTPTAAAELVCPDRAALWSDASQRLLRAQTALRRRLDREAQRLDQAAYRIGRPAQTLQRHRQRLHELQRRLERPLAQRLQWAREHLVRQALRLERAPGSQLEAMARRLDQLASRCRALDPSAVLQRGYAWVEDEAGRPITRRAGLRAGDPITAVWSDGRVSARVESLDRAGRGDLTGPG